MEKEIVARDLILTLTILSIIFILAHQPTPVKSVKVDYCFVGAENMYFPCSGLKYRLNI